MSKDYSVLGLARRAGQLAIGHDAVVDALHKGNAHLILLTSDASVHHENEINQTGNGDKILHLPDSMDVVGVAVGKRACILAVTDEGFSKMILKKLKT